MALGDQQKCVKPANSLGVCTVTTTRHKVQDWIVCPYRALDPHGLEPIVKALFPGVPVRSDVIAPATMLKDSMFLRTIAASESQRAFLYFSEKLGGELSIPKSNRSPELSFDVAVFGCTIGSRRIEVGQFGVYEVQTMDFHGSYRHAVTALLNAVNLHGAGFPDALRQNLVH